MRRWWAGGLLLASVLLASLRLVQGQPPTPPAAPAAPAAREVPGRYLGAGSCATAGCHGANGPKGAVGSEYTTWLSHDPHARSYETLLTERSCQMMARLKDHLPGPSEAHRNAACLGCHVRPGFQAEGLSLRADGVSCENCHGPAERWIDTHYQQPGQRAAVGMRDTRNLAERARSCVACHVGAPGMDVNHDLIAAGHPRLQFEFRTYQALLPPHWDTAKDEAAAGGRAAFAERAWAVGQVVVAEAALELLAHRAAAASAPWPELAETDCFACHHQLRGVSWRQKPPPDRRPGSLPWNRWYTSSLPAALAMLAAAPAEPTLEALRQQLEAKAAPDRTAVATQAHAAAQRLRQVDTSRYDPARKAQHLRTIFDHSAARRQRSWDDAMQGYLALDALTQDLPKLGGRLRPLADALRFEDASPGQRFPAAEADEVYEQLRAALPGR